MIWTNYECGCGINNFDPCDGDCYENSVWSGRTVGGVYQSGKDIGRIITPMCCGNGYAMNIYLMPG